MRSTFVGVLALLAFGCSVEVVPFAGSPDGSRCEDACVPPSGLDASAVPDGSIALDASTASDASTAPDASTHSDASLRADAAMTPPDGGSSPADASSNRYDAGPSGLTVTGNHLYTPDGKVWRGRGANLADTRSCNACTSQPPNLAEVKRRIDELVDVWKVNFLRLALESYSSSDGYRNPANYKSALDDPAYLDDIRSIVQHVGTKPGVYVLVSVWVDPFTSAEGWPTIATPPARGTNTLWAALAAKLADQPHALFGVINEPESNYDGKQDAEVWTRMSAVVKAIRDVEDAAGAPYHVVTVQGTGGWSRRLDYYVTHPITERGGKNVAYEVHVYNPAADFVSLFENAAKTLPLIIGEFGPDGTYMKEPDCTKLMDRAQALEIPHLAWIFHMRCDPNLIVDNSKGGCGVGMALQPTSWGTLFKARLATPW